VKLPKLRTLEDKTIEKFCPHCQTWKNANTEFSPKPSSKKIKYRSWCKSCCVDDVSTWRKNKNRRYESELVGRIQIILSNVVRSEGNIRSEYLHKAYQEQNGMCYYTGAKMKLMSDIKLDPMIMSADRIDSSKGYVEGNVVLCCYGINVLKGRHSVEKLYESLELFYTESKNNYKL
jgi:hypothetical protein